MEMGIEMEAQREGGAQVQDRASGVPGRMSQEELARLVTLDAEWWFAHLARVKIKTGREVTGIKEAGGLNILQRRVHEAYRKCAAAGVPCLIMVLKPRQKGASTDAEAICYHHMRKHAQLNGALMGDVDATSDKVFEIYRRYAEADLYPWKDGFGKFTEKGNLTDEITLGNGSKWWKETAGSKNAGRSGTVQVLHMDEVAFYPVTSTRDPTTAVLGSFAKELPVSLGFATSTPNGASGWFYNTWNEADNGWIKIFAAWFEFDDSYRSFRGAEERARFAESLDDDERTEQELYGVTLEQLNWRRYIIKTDYEGDADKFKQEYPSNDRDCFLLSSRPRFDPRSLKALKLETLEQVKRATPGIFHIPNPKFAIFRPDSRVGSGGVKLFEEPRLGCRYVLAIDTCRGKDQQLGHGTTADPDYHSAGVIRAEYMDAKTGTYYRPKVVCHHHSRVEADVLADIVSGMSWYFGSCMVIPELNDGAGFYLVKELHKRHVNLYRREPLRAAQQTPRPRTEQEVLEAFGWNTDKSTKRWIVDAAVPIIRDKRIELSDPLIEQEFEKFIVNKHGQSEAMPGFHDDCVMMVLIGLYNLGAATEYRPTHLRSVDLMRLARDPRYMAPGGGWRRG